MEAQVFRREESLWGIISPAHHAKQRQHNSTFLQTLPVQRIKFFLRYVELTPVQIRFGTKSYFLHLTTILHLCSYAISP
jgi:hypothetical protein